MRSKTTQKIIDSTPDEIRESVREYANEMVNSAHSYTEGAETSMDDEHHKKQFQINYLKLLLKEVLPFIHDFSVSGIQDREYRKSLQRLEQRIKTAIK